MSRIQVVTPVQTWLKMSVKEDRWDDVVEFVGGGKSITLLWNMMSGD